MSQITAPLAINNGAATPVAVSFAPERVAPELSTFVDRSSGVSALYPRISVTFSPAANNRPTARIEINIDYPKASVANGVSTVASVGRFRSYAVVPDNFDTADRSHFAAFIKNALANVTVNNVIKDLDPMY